MGVRAIVANTDLSVLSRAGTEVKQMGTTELVRPTWWLRAATLCVASGLLGCADRAPEQRAAGEREPLPVSLAPAAVREVERTVDVVGTLFGDEEATISAKASGRVLEIAKDVGDEAARGEMLARIDPTDYELAVAQRRAALQATLAELGLESIPAEGFEPDSVPEVQLAIVQAQNAEARLARARTLFEQTPPRIAEQDYADLQTAAKVAAGAVEVARMEAHALLANAWTRSAELAQAEQALADTVVRAPGGGGGAGGGGGGGESTYAVARRMVSVGEYVTPGTPMFVLVDADPVKFRAAVPERYVAEVKVGQHALVRVDAFEAPFAGRVARISPRVNPESRTFDVEVQVPNAEGLLRPGAFARGAIVTRTEPALFVPADALVTFAGVSKVFTVRDGTAVEHRVQPGPRHGEWVEIVAGLEGPADVAVSGLARLAVGVPVRVEGVAAATDAVATPAGSGG